MGLIINNVTNASQQTLNISWYESNGIEFYNWFAPHNPKTCDPIDNWPQYQDNRQD